jgi:hypothetical protein
MPDGPVLYGNGGGGLGIVADNSPYLALEWNWGHVLVHPHLDVDGEIMAYGGIVTGYAEIDRELNVYGDLTVSNGYTELHGDLTVYGLKFFVVPHPTDTNKEIAYVATEGPEPVTFVRGSTNLVNGEAVISLPETYAMVTAEEGLTVQLTPRGAWLQLYVSDVNPRQLTVREAQGQSGRFDYLVQGVRKGYEDYQPIRPRRQTAAALARPQPPTAKKGQGQP